VREYVEIAKGMAALGYGCGPGRRRAMPVRTEKKIGRNTACPCGSGKKYKKCCLNKTQEICRE